MIPYNSYRFIFPPRADTICPPAVIEKFEGRYLAQPKLNGSCMVIATDGKQLKITNRVGESITNVKMKPEEFLSLHRGKGWMVIVGEYMNKNKNDESGKPFNHKFVLFDIIVYENQQLLGQSFKERINLLDALYKSTDFSKYLTQIETNVFRVKSFDLGFRLLYNEITKIDMYEGFVFKKPSYGLENGIKVQNNHLGQAKVRKETKNYKY